MKPKITTVNFGDLALPVDADASWQRFLAMGPRERVVAASDTCHFQIHLGWMDLPPEMLARFWKHFSTPETIKARSVATYGLTETNHDEEFGLVDFAMEFHKGRMNGRFKKDPEMAKTHALGLAVMFSEMVATYDPAKFRRLLAVIENHGLPKGDRGGLGSEDCFMLEKFTELHAQTRSLPTKSQLRIACGMNDLAQKKMADKRMTKLGLWGLPTEPEI